MDNLQGLDGFQIWETSSNWKNNPSSGFEIQRNLVGFSESKLEIFPLSEDRPEWWEISIVFFSKEDENSFLTKFSSLQGRLSKFWFPNLQTRFTLARDIAINSATIEVKNNFHNYRGYERIFFKLSDESSLSFKIAGMELSTENLVLSLETNVDRSISISDIDLLTTLHLCRLDTDEIEINYKNAHQSETKIKIVELVKEYT